MQHHCCWSTAWECWRGSTVPVVPPTSAAASVVPDSTRSSSRRRGLYRSRSAPGGGTAARPPCCSRLTPRSPCRRETRLGHFTRNGNAGSGMHLHGWLRDGGREQWSMKDVV